MQNYKLHGLLMKMKGMRLI